MGGGGDGGAAHQAQEAENERQNSVNNGMNNINNIFSQFDDNFYNKRRDAYLDYANPQLSSQYADANKQLTFQLARNGTLDSTARTGQDAQLAKLYAQGQTGIDNEALDYENTARNNIASAKSNLTSELVSTGNDNAATDAATSQAVVSSMPDIYQPVPALFSGFTGALAQQAQGEQLSSITNGAYQPRFNTGLFGASPSAVKVIS